MYKRKYLKYKTKYNFIKNQLGGDVDISSLPSIQNTIKQFEFKALAEKVPAAKKTAAEKAAAKKVAAEKVAAEIAVAEIAAAEIAAAEKAAAEIAVAEIAAAEKAAAEITVAEIAAAEIAAAEKAAAEIAVAEKAAAEKAAAEKAAAEKAAEKAAVEKAAVEKAAATIDNIFITNIINDQIRVVSLSDIHGDIQSFIIALRDCAKVIRKKSNFNFDNTQYDRNMEELLQKDIDSEILRTNTYIDDLNYEWCGVNTYVVICGDIIDPYRGKVFIEEEQEEESEKTYLPICVKKEKKNKLQYKEYKYLKVEGEYYEELDEDTEFLPCEYYPQIELKILWFINALNKQIKTNSHTNCKIIKLLGNHDLAAIIDSSDPNSYTNKYAFPNDLKKINYYEGVKRQEIFNVNKPGFKFLIEGGIGILVKINSAIFVHGDLTETYNTYDNINQFMNDSTKQKQSLWKIKLLKKYLDYESENSSLLSRKRGNLDGDASSRIDDPVLGEQFCNELKEAFIKFKKNSSIITDDVNNLKLVIGHCIQSSYIVESYKNITYNLIKNETIEPDPIVDIFGVSAYTGYVNVDNKSTIVGITMECKIKDKDIDKQKYPKLEKYDLYQLYRVDIGSSRGQDLSYRYITDPKTENEFIYSKTPQILEIDIDGTVKIIKSKMKNTRIHLPRYNYEKRIIDNDIKELNLSNNKTYQQKYLKYKNKYLQLKQIIK